MQNAPAPRPLPAHNQPPSPPVYDLKKHQSSGFGLVGFWYEICGRVGTEEVVDEFVWIDGDLHSKEDCHHCERCGGYTAEPLVDDFDVCVYCAEDNEFHWECGALADQQYTYYASRGC